MAPTNLFSKLWHFLKGFWTALDHYGRLVTALALGGSFIVSAITGAALWTIDFLAWPFLVLLIIGAIRDYGDFWDTSFSFDVWNNVRDGLMPERGFHTAFNATRDAYHALFDTEALARNANERRESMLNWEQTRVTETLNSIEDAERELVAFLSNY